MNVTHNKPLQSRKKSTTNKTSREILPILIPCKEGEPADGSGNFQLIQVGKYESRSGPNVRLLKRQDISDLPNALSVEDYELLTATLELKQAHEINDSLQQARAYRKLMPHLGRRGLDPRVFTHPMWATVHVPRLATKPMEGARMVLWFSGRSRQYIPAIYCPDLRTAIFARAFLSLQTCPHCGIVFLPEKENVIYCRPAHGQAHRVARMRAKQRGKHGKR
jgi:hypothetical protein